MISRVIKNSTSKFYVYMKNHKKVRYFSIAIGCVISLFFLINLGRYVKKIIDNHLFKTQEFYFNSDKLTEDIKPFEISYWNGTSSYDINIQMDSLDNDLKGTDIDIDYSITCEVDGAATCQLSKTSSTIEGNSTGNNRDSFLVTIIPNGQFQEGDYVEVTVKATATEPYKKTIGAKFKLIVNYYQIGYQIIDQPNQTYMTVLITNAAKNYTVTQAFGSYNVGDQLDVFAYETLSPEDQKKCIGAKVTLEFDPDDLRLDMTNTNYLNKISTTTETLDDGFVYVNKLVFGVGAESSAMVKFYKMDVSKNYTFPLVNDTSVVTFTAE